MKTRHLVRLVGLVSLIALGAPADDSVAQQRPDFGATVARVRVDAIVTDAEGNFVDDLRPDEFVLYEDGAPQRILNTQVVDLAAGTVAEFRRTMAPTIPDFGSGVSTPSNIEYRPVSSATSGNFGAMIFLIDLPGLDRRDKDRFAEEWQAILNETDLMGMPRAVYMIDQVGRINELAGLTLDVNELREAVRVVRDAPLVQRSVRHRLLNVAADMVANEAVDFLPPTADDLNELRTLEAQERARTRSTFRQLTQFCNALSVRQGRTALVWVTSAVQLTEGGPGTALAAAYMESNTAGFVTGTADRSRRSGNTLFSTLSADSDLTSLQQDLHHAANSANVSIYTVDPTPPGASASLPSDLQVGNAELTGLLNSSRVQSSLEGLKDALWQAAAETGGRATIGAAEIGRALQEIDQDASRFYLLSYEPPAPHGDGEFHSIRVDVLRPGTNVRQRSGYVDLGPALREERAIDAALMLPGAVTGLPVHAELFRAWSVRGEPIVNVVIALEQSLAQQQVRFPDNVVHQVHLVALDTEGRVVDEVHQEMRPLVAPSARVRSGERPIVYLHQWDLPPGEYDLRVAVRDAASGDIGAAQVAFEIPESPEDWTASDLMLAVADGGQRPVPLLSDSVLLDESLFAYVEVAGGEEPILSGVLRGIDGAGPFVALPATPLEQDAHGIHRGALRLRNLRPGDYTLEVVVADGVAGEERTFHASLQVLAPLAGLPRRQ